VNNINQHIIDQLNTPRSAIINSITAELNEIQAPLDNSSKGLIHNICRRLLKDSGDCITMTREELLGGWGHTAVPHKDLERAVDALIARNFLSSDHDFIRIKSNALGKFIHASIEADVTALSKVESMIAREFRSYQHNKRYLSQQEINQVEPVLSRLILPTDMHRFVLDSIAYRRRRRLIRVLFITGVIVALSGLSVVALVQSANARDSAEVARENELTAIKLADELTVKSDTIEKQNIELAEAKDSVVILYRIAQSRADTAESERSDAIEARGEAEHQLGLTIVAKKDADAQKHAAEKATAEAIRQTRTADSAKFVAIKQSIAADSAKLIALDAQENAEILRSALLSVVLAEKSLSTPASPSSDTMRAMVSRVAFELETASHTSHDHHAVHPKLYSSLYYAHKYLHRSSSHNADRLGSEPIHAMSYSALNNTLYLSYGVDGFKTMHFSKSLADRNFDFPDVDSINTNLLQPSHNLLLNENKSLIMTSGELILHTNLNNNITSEHRIAHGVKILNVIPFNKENEYIVLASTNKLYNFNSVHGTFIELPDIVDVTQVAYIKRLNILIYGTDDSQLFLVNFNKDITAHWNGREGLIKLEVKDYGDVVFVVFGYLNGVVRVGITSGDELTAHEATNDEPVSTRALPPPQPPLIETILSSNIHTGFITDIDFANNAHQMVVASGDGTATIWNLDAWSQRRTDYRPIVLDDHRGWVTSCAINSEENLVFTGTKHGIIKFWSIDPAYYANNICKKLSGRSFNEREWGIYIGNEVPYTDQICK